MLDKDTTCVILRDYAFSGFYHLKLFYVVDKLSDEVWLLMVHPTDSKGINLITLDIDVKLCIE